MTRFLMVAVLALVFEASAWAGGLPPVYVVVDKVVLEPNADAPERIRIEGSFVRFEKDKEYVYCKPVEGYVYLSLKPGKEKECREEWTKWQKAAGTGKVVGVGSSLKAGSFLTVKIRKLDEKTDRPDAAYTTDLLGHFGNMYTEGEWELESPVSDLLAFTKARKQPKPEKK
jgi:hypothetical protein